MSVEFNLVYRWHATVSEPDTYWTEQLFAKAMNGADPSKVTHISRLPYTLLGLNRKKQVSAREFLKNAAQMLMKDSSAPVTEWTFGGSVALFGSTKWPTLILGITASLVKTAASTMQTWPEFCRMRRRRPQARSRRAERPKSYVSLNFWVLSKAGHGVFAR